jgi:hypothetical protein
MMTGQKSLCVIMQKPLTLDFKGTELTLDMLAILEIA